MCLYTSKNKPLIAKKDIPVYKVLYHYDMGKKGVQFITPYRGFRMRPGTHYYQDKPLKPVKYHPYPNQYRVSVGLHAYTKLKKAKKFNSFFSFAYIIKMIVPKGSKYYVSDNGDYIVANNLVWHEDAKIYKPY